jgi:hypothetical protein
VNRILMMSLAWAVLCYVASGCASAGTDQDRPDEAFVKMKLEMMMLNRKRQDICSTTR